MLTGPEKVTRKVLKRAGMTPDDIDLYELNEAFASVVMLFMKLLDIPHDKLNVNGGAIAMGHPLGATGAMILGTCSTRWSGATWPPALPRSASAPAWAPPPSSSASDPVFLELQVMTNIRVETDADGIVTLTWDMPGRSMNVLSEDSISEYVAAADTAIADPSVKGVVVTSAKPAFIAGADLSMLQKQTSGTSKAAAPKQQTAKAIFDNLMQLNLALRRIEKGGKPFVAAINGLALGGGLEVCLACHHRVVAERSAHPARPVESKVGLMPGAGGTQRMPRLMAPWRRCR